MKSMIGYAVAAGGLALLISGSAVAQTQEECVAGLEELNTAITSQEGVGESARAEARELSAEAQDAHDTGDYARCMTLVGDGAKALEG
ncbi:MAG: hypothetical protein ROR55_06295 [Devosia sp.]